VELQGRAIGRSLLHAHLLAVPHPRTEAPLLLRAPLPEAWSVVDALDWDPGE
jgi:hypothetical protein